MKKKLLTMMMTLTMAVGLLACGSSETETTTEENETTSEGEASTSSEDIDLSDITIAYVPTTMNNPFWTAMMGGIKEEMESFGMNPDTQLVTVDSDSDQATMNNNVYDLINQEVDAIILAPMDTTAVAEALQACYDAGIPVINVDTAVDRDDLVVSIIASDNYKAGVLCAEDMMSKLDEGSKIYIMNQPSGTACVQREEGFLDTVGDYFEIVGTSDTQGDTATSLGVAEDAITAESDLAAFFCINDMGALGCVQACAAANRDDILIYGVDGNPQFMGYVEDGSATASAAQQPSVIGSSAVYAVVATLNGENVEKEQTIAVELITTENISEFDISDWQ